MRRLLALVLLLLVAAPAALAQEEAGVRIQDVDTDGFPTVRLLVSTGSPTELAPDDFTVTEGGVDYTVDTADPVAAGAIEAVLVIDTSGSMAGAPLQGAKDAALAFVDELPEPSQIAVLGFGSTAEVVQPLTTDRELVIGAIDGLEAGGETALYDAVALGLDQFTQGGADNLVVLSDGADTASEIDQADLESALGDFGGSFFVVELQGAESDPEALEALTEAADGILASAEDPDALQAIYEGIAVAVTSQYVVSYTSEGAGVTSVAVTVAGLGTSEAIPIGLPAAPGTTTTTSTSTTTTVPPTVPPGTTSEPPFWTSGPWLTVGLITLFVGLAGVLYFLFSPGEGSARVRPTFRSRGTQALTGVSKGLVQAAERGTGGRSRGLDASLDRAGIRLRAGEWVVVFAALTLLAGVLGFVLGGSLIIAGVAALLVVIVGWILPSIIGDRRQSKFEDQLPDVLTMLASTIRTGYAPIQATELVAREVEEPASVELSRAIAETRLGRDYIDALEGVAGRMSSDDFQWVVEAMAINRDVGGDVSEVLDQVSETIRDRASLRRTIAALSAEGRLSAWILVAVPFFLAWFLWQRDPEYLLPLTETITGLVMLVGSAVLLVIGVIIIRNIIRLED